MTVSETETAQPAGPQWYCPGCGTRYFGPGVCTNNHPSTELLLDADTPTEGGQAPTATEDSEGLGESVQTAEAPVSEAAEETEPAITAVNVVPPEAPTAPEPAPAPDAVSGSDTGSAPAPPEPTSSHAKELALQAITAAGDALHKAASLLSGL